MMRTLYSKYGRLLLASLPCAKKGSINATAARFLRLKVVVFVFSNLGKITAMPDSTCNSRSLSWLVRPCIPKSPADLPIQTQTRILTRPANRSPPESEDPPISSLPDDLLLACLSRVPLPSLPSAAAACRRFSLLLSSPHVFPLRRSLVPLTPTLFSLSLSLFSAADDILALAVHREGAAMWRVSDLPLPAPLSGPCSVVGIDNTIYVLGRGSAVRLDAWTLRIYPIPPPLIPRKKFATAAINGRIYVAGGNSRASTVEIYDPAADAWRVGPEAPTRRYGCIGAAVGEIFYVAGGLRVGEGVETRAAHAAAGTVDAYWVRAGQWAPRGTRAVPGGGCVVGACGVGPSLYVLASNAVEFTLWRWEWDEAGSKRRGGGGGEWVPLEPPPVQGRVGLGGAVRFSCCAVGDRRMVAAVHVGGAARGQNGELVGSMEGAVLVYDVGNGEWSRGPNLPAGFRRAGLLCVDC